MVLSDQLLTPWATIGFFCGKVIRFLLFFIFLFSVFGNKSVLLSYSREQIIIFFLVFNIVDISGQFLFRGVYMFRTLVISGNYDFDLLKPLPSFFRPLFGWSDIIDLGTLIPLWVLFGVYYGTHFPLNFEGIFVFSILFASSMVFIFAIHLLVASLAILTESGDQLLWIYRDTLEMSKFPTDIYKGLVRYVITYIIPIVLVVTIPAKGLLGLLDVPIIMVSVITSVLCAFLSMWIWKFSVTRYASASS